MVVIEAKLVCFSVHGTGKRRRKENKDPQASCQEEASEGGVNKGQSCLRRKGVLLDANAACQDQGSQQKERIASDGVPVESLTLSL